MAKMLPPPSMYFFSSAICLSLSALTPGRTKNAYVFSAPDSTA